MTYPKEIYKRIKPVISEAEALERAKKRKPVFDKKRVPVRGKTASDLINSLQNISKEHGDVVVERSYDGYLYAIIKTPRPVEQIAKDLRRQDKYRYEDRRRAAERKWSAVERQMEAARARVEYINNTAVISSGSCKCKCCCCR